MYSTAMAALGMLSTIATGLAIDAYGPISDNAGGISEMAGMSQSLGKGSVGNLPKEVGQLTQLNSLVREREVSVRGEKRRTTSVCVVDAEAFTSRGADVPSPLPASSSMW